MSGESVKRLDAAGLRAAGRTPETPFCLALADGSEVLLQRLLRVLPGKRIVGEGQWNGRRVLVKLFVAGGSARHWAQEKVGIEALRNAGIPTPDMLLATPMASGGHVLLTTFVDAAQTLAEAWVPLSALPAGSPAALEVLCPAFRMLGTLHACGLVQEDLHLGNFLRCTERLYVIDGDAVRSISPGKGLDEPRASANLAVLLAQLPMAWDAWRNELLEAYRAGGGPDIGDTARLESELSRVRGWRLKDFLGKTLRDCTLFKVRRSALRFTAVRRTAAERLAPLLAAPDAAMLHGRLLKDGKTCTVAQIEQAGYSLVVKRYNLKSLRHALERFWRPTRAWHSWREGHRLLHLGIATPTPLALIEERIGPLRRRAFLINEFCPGVSLLHFLSPDREPEVDVASALVSLFHKLHTLRISHGDLKASNLLWHDGSVFMIDLDALLQHRSATGFARAWRRDRERLLRNWPASSILHQWLERNLPPASSGRG